MSHYSTAPTVLEDRQFTSMESVDRAYYDQQLPFSQYSATTSQRHVPDSYVYYSTPARYSAPFGYASSREDNSALWASSVDGASSTDIVDTQPRSMIMDNDTALSLASSVMSSRPSSTRRTSYSDSQTPPDSTESMSQTGSSSFDDNGYTYSSSSCSSPQPVTPPYPPMDSPAVKVEQDDQGGCFILDELSTMSYFTSSKRAGGRDNGQSAQHEMGSQQSSEVPLRATGVSDEMKEMMRCFRVDPFSLHSLSHVDIVLDDDELESRGRSRKPGRGGSPPRTASWTGLEAKPLDEEPLIFEFQLRIDGSSEEDDTESSDSSVRDSSVSSVEAKEEMQLRPFSPSFQLISEQSDIQEVQSQQMNSQWQEQSESYQNMVTNEDYSGQSVAVQEYQAPPTTGTNLVHPRPMVYSPPITLDASYSSVESRQNMSVSPELRPKWIEAPRRVDKSPLMSNVDHERPESKNRRLHPATSHPYLRKSLQNLNMRHQQAAIHAALPHHQVVPMEQVQAPTYVDYQQQYSAPQYTETASIVSHPYPQQVAVQYERENAYAMSVQGSWSQQEVGNDASRFTESDDRQTAVQQNTVVEEDMMSVHAMSPSPSMMEAPLSQHHHYHSQVITSIPTAPPRRWSLPDAHGTSTLAHANHWPM